MRKRFTAFAITLSNEKFETQKLRLNCKITSLNDEKPRKKKSRKEKEKDNTETAQRIYVKMYYLQQ